jgi:hypothetical protein
LKPSGSETRSIAVFFCDYQAMLVDGARQLITCP